MCSCTQADRRGVVCHLVGRGCGLTRLCVLEANARFPTEYDSKGYGLMRLAGHTLRHWPVSSRPCDRRTPRPALHRVAWEAGFLAHNFCTRNSCTHTHNSFTRNFLTHNSFRLIHHYFATSSRTQLLHTRLFHPRTSHRSNTHTQLFHIRLCDRQSFTHTTWSHTIFHTHNFVPHSFHTQLYHTQLLFFNLSILHHLLCLSFLPVPLQLLFLLIGRS